MGTAAGRVRAALRPTGYAYCGKTEWCRVGMTAGDTALSHRHTCLWLPQSISLWITRGPSTLAMRLNRPCPLHVHRGRSALAEHHQLRLAICVATMTPSMLDLRASHTFHCPSSSRRRDAGSIALFIKERRSRSSDFWSGYDRDHRSPEGLHSMDRMFVPMPLTTGSW